MILLGGRASAKTRRRTTDGNKVATPTCVRSTLQHLGERADHSWLGQLSPDPQTNLFAPNKSSREVRSGHYVRVAPTPLRNPKLVIHSDDVARSLGISDDEVASDDFIAFFSGHQDRVEALESWCTPYALTIMGRRQVSNCPFGNGNGYGDGRAISVGEVVVDGQRWEMQLKGAGKTPFCRRSDGRAVLRSSIREFLASEAMHSLGVETTRALSLVVSASMTVNRPWYSGDDRFGGASNDPDTFIIEACAITARVAPSFLRVGHVDLFARRAGRSEAAAAELRQIVEHMLFREYPNVAAGQPFSERAYAMLEVVAERLGAMVAGWLRVGFCQGNFNADNCLVSGRTMDYGPFGFMDKYHSLFAKWTGSGKHYAFMNQPGAAIANYKTLVESIAPLFQDDKLSRIEQLLQRGTDRINAASKDVFRIKMGFANAGAEAAEPLWTDLAPLMENVITGIDYTIFWRQLAVVMETPLGAPEALLVDAIREAFYGSPSARLLERWSSWLTLWRTAVLSEEGGGGDPAVIAARLRAVNPKYVLREWMLAAAYEEASTGTFDLVRELHSLALRPYDEQPERQAKYYCRAPEEVLTKAGVAYMS